MAVSNAMDRAIAPRKKWRAGSLVDESQMLLPLSQTFPALVEEASREWVESAHAGARSRSRRKARHNRAKEQSDNQLTLPLFEAYPELKKKEELDWVESSEWLEDEWVHLHGVLLERSLEDLTVTTAGTELIEDITTWICEPIVHNGKIPRSFSFQACAELFGLDAEALQLMALRSMEGLENHRGAIDAVRGHISVAVKRHEAM